MRNNNRCIFSHVLIRNFLTLDGVLITPREKRWGGALWSASYFAGSWGGTPISMIRPYSERQNKPN